MDEANHDDEARSSDCCSEKAKIAIKEGERWTPQALINKDSALLSPGSSKKTNESDYAPEDLPFALTAGQARGAQGICMAESPSGLS